MFRLDSGIYQDIAKNPQNTTQDWIAEAVDNIKPDRSDLDLLFSSLLSWGVPLDLHHHQETINNVVIHTVYSGDDPNSRPELVACFAPGLSEEILTIIAKRNPLRAVFRDHSFVDAAAKINAVEIFKRFSPETEKIRVI